MNANNETSIVISTGTILKSILFVALFSLLFYLKDIILVILTAIVLASAIEPAVDFFSKRKIGRLPSVIIIYLLVAIVFLSSFYFLVPPLLDDAIGFLNKMLPITQSVAIDTNSASGIVSNLKDISSSNDLVSLLTDISSATSGITGGFFSKTSLIFGSVFDFILIIVLSFYFIVQETGVDDFLRVIAPVKNQDYVIDLWKRSQKKIGLWMQGQVLLGVIIGVLTYLGLTILGVPYAFLLSIIATLFELVPVFGPILSAVPAIIVAFSTSGLTLVAMTAALYLIIHQFENHLIYPLVVRKVVGVPPILVIIALVIGFKLAGFLGVILSVPVSAALKEYIDDVEKKKEVEKRDM